MAWKRPAAVVGFSSGNDSDDPGFDVDDDDVATNDCQDGVSLDSLSFTSFDSDLPSSSDLENVDLGIYKKCLRDYKKIMKLKKKLTYSLKHQSKRHKSVQKQKEAFTRFSVSLFSSVIDSLSDESRKVIDSYGFGSLLVFDKCYVPNHFAKWVARMVDYKFGDIIIDGKVISLTKESVHLVLDLPIGGRPFPADCNTSKSILLNKFSMNKIPPVTYFANRIIKKHTSSEEDLLISFILAAMNSFLCPNSSLKPSSKYFGIFEDIQNLKHFDWSGYVLEWLLDHVKKFNKGKSNKGKDSQTLGGCLYYLAVIYLDYVDFGSRQLPHDLPRIAVWKENMIKMYLELDMKSPGVFGFRPLMDLSRTCYCKNARFLRKSCPALSMDSEFMDKLDTCSACKLPPNMKTGICKLIEQHCFNSGLSINMDITSVANLPENLKMTFSQLLQHVYSIDSRTQDLVLNLLKVISDNCPRDDDEDINTNGVNASADNYNSRSEDIMAQKDCSNCEVPPVLEDAVAAMPAVGGSISEDQCHTHLPTTQLPECSKKAFVPNLKSSSIKISSQMNNTEIEKVMKKLTKNSVSSASPVYRTPSQVQFPPSGYPPNRGPEALYRKVKSRRDLCQNYITQTDIASVRNPLCDISNSKTPSQKEAKYLSSDIPERHEESDKEIILLDNDNNYAPDSVPPSRHTVVQNVHPDEALSDSPTDSPVGTQ